MGWGFRNLGFGEREDSGESEGERADGESESESDREYGLDIVGSKTVEIDPTGLTGCLDRSDRSELS